MASYTSSAFASVAAIFLLWHLLSAEAQEGQSCPSSFGCGQLGPLDYPFTTTFRPRCGLYAVNCTEPNATVGLPNYGLWYDVLSSFSSKSFLLGDAFLLHAINSNCSVFDGGFHLPKSSSLKLKILWTEALWNCPKKLVNNSDSSLHLIKKCGDHGIYRPANVFLQVYAPNCFKIDYPIFLIVQLSDQCSECTNEAGRCQDLKNGAFHCSKRNGRRKLILLLGLGISGGIIALFILGLVFWCLRKIKFGSPALASRSISFDATKTDLGRSKMYFSLPIFSYNELEEATNNFDPEMELGDGGFGTVYYGKLKDGREVAVKRLYERNYRRLEQFMNEIEILTRLRHQNLVSLFGCTSRRSRELLLVYEYVPNGTVADHLHSDQAKCGTLTWPVRMSIAIETARALSYLHASDIIHRDVKSTNILLDNSFSVKVADFGLSRLLPTDVTHISTVPQGTPGYLDLEYHQCYQLTDKSDVYSFGVVLLELISSLPAIDVTRKKDEINLSSYAMNRIQRCAFSELVDPRLGFESNYKVRRMTTSVAELAFQCLQHKKEFRPSMDEVLQALMNIQSADYEAMGEEEKDENDAISKTQTEAEHAWLLRHTQGPPSPNSVIHKWSSSKSITPAASR